MVREKLRIRFRKTGDLRLISHHDLMRCLERMLRRAALPFHSTDGFNPKPRLVFALSLPLGMIGWQEVVELELDAEVPAEEVRARLAQQAPAGLEIFDARRIDPKMTAHVRRVSYRVVLPQERCADLPARMDALLTTASLWIDRSRPRKRRVDLRPYIHDLRLRANALEMDLFVTPDGAARPVEVLELLGLGDLIPGLIIERTAMEIGDESVRTESCAEVIVSPPTEVELPV
jgi:radical SAM-linked protein